MKKPRRQLRSNRNVQHDRTGQVWIDDDVVAVIVRTEGLVDRVHGCDYFFWRHYVTYLSWDEGDVKYFSDYWAEESDYPWEEKLTGSYKRVV